MRVPSLKYKVSKIYLFLKKQAGWKYFGAVWKHSRIFIRLQVQADTQMGSKNRRTVRMCIFAKIKFRVSNFNPLMQIRQSKIGICGGLFLAILKTEKREWN